MIDIKIKLYCLLLVLFWFVNLPLVFAQNTSFELSSSPGVGMGPNWVVTADINDDGKVDLITANYQGTLTVLTNDGHGGFVLFLTHNRFGTFSLRGRFQWGWQIRFGRSKLGRQRADGIDETMAVAALYWPPTPS